MTRQYLAGELSLLLAWLQETTADPASRSAFAKLRREAETTPLAALGPVASRALLLSDTVCWQSASRGESETFRRHAAAAAKLYEFGVCAGLIDE